MPLLSSSSCYFEVVSLSLYNPWILAVRVLSHPLLLRPLRPGCEARLLPPSSQHLPPRWQPRAPSRDGGRGTHTVQGHEDHDSVLWRCGAEPHCEYDPCPFFCILSTPLVPPTPPSLHSFLYFDSSPMPNIHAPLSLHAHYSCVWSWIRDGICTLFPIKRWQFNRRKTLFCCLVHPQCCFQILQDVQRFLEVPLETLTSSQVKIHSMPLNETIDNYEDVARTLKGSKFEKFLAGDLWLWLCTIMGWRWSFFYSQHLNKFCMRLKNQGHAGH